MVYSLNDRVDALELDIWPSLLLGYCAGPALWPSGVARPVFWGASDGSGGSGSALRCLGRAIIPTDIERFLARARVGDLEGADMLLSERARQSDQDEADGSRGCATLPIAVIRDGSHLFCIT